MYITNNTAELLDIEVFNTQTHFGFTDVSKFYTSCIKLGKQVKAAYKHLNTNYYKVATFKNIVK